MDSTDLWSFLFPPDVWTPIGEFMWSTVSTAFVFGAVLFFIYLGLMYADLTKGIKGAWNPWVIFWILVMNILMFFIISWCLGPMTLSGFELYSSTPNTCVGDTTSEGGLCYQNCKPGYHGFGVRCYADTHEIGVGTVLGLEPCPDNTDGQGDWVNMGLTCTRWKNQCHYWGTDIIGHWWTGCVETVGRLDHGGQCPGPQDFPGKNYDAEIKNWKRANEKPDPVIDPVTKKMETAVQANQAGHKTCADIATVGSDMHTERIDGLCYKKCPSDYPEHVPGMPYLCYKGGELSYDRGGGKVPPIMRILGKYPFPF